VEFDDSFSFLSHVARGPRTTSFCTQLLYYNDCTAGEKIYKPTPARVY